MSKRPLGGVGVGGLLKGPDSSLDIHIVVVAGKILEEAAATCGGGVVGFGGQTPEAQDVMHFI